MRPQCARPSLDSLIAELAERQHGVVSREQLLARGVSARAVGRRITAGRLHPIHRGVYAVGHPVLAREGRWMAAVLAGGPGTVLSHRSAAALWGVRQSERVEVIVPRHRRARANMTVHESSLDPDEVTTHHAIPTTTVARTLLDLAAVVPRHQAARALHEAEVLRLAADVPLAHLVVRRPHHPGAAAIRAVVAERSEGHDATRSELEDRFLSFVARHALPPPLTNRIVEGLECDAVWPAHRLIVELDGHAAHHTRRAFEDDRQRDRRLVGAGWRVFRVTWRQLHRHPDALLRDLRPLLDCAQCPGASSSSAPPARSAPRRSTSSPARTSSSSSG